MSRTPRATSRRALSGSLGAWIGGLALAIAGVVGPLAPSAASAAPALAATSTASAPAALPAANLSLFNPGNIIGDAVFFNRNAMTESQIQSFLVAKVPTCQSGYTCLKDWYDTSRSVAADQMCDAYAGGVRERASRIIYKVAQACGINPQVILVTLQKEQGLVTHTWPSTWRYDAAMGQACPDTAACDTRYKGFFNQVYGAAWQFKRYANPPGTSQYFTWYAPGKTWNVLYNPNRSCGTSAVRIANQATANLYYYTPYQPNKAALSAGYGTGNSCSSYGNRNFYNYFTDWFGSTQYPVTGATATEWNRTGGAGGQLGLPTGPAKTVSANGGGTVQQFQTGTIWLAKGSSTAYSMGSGPFITNYRAVGAEASGWGWPTGAAQCRLVENGCSMAFQKGTVYWTAATSSRLVPKAMDAGYAALGGPTSAFGYPSADAKAGPSGGFQLAFQRGALAYSPATGTQGLEGDVLEKWEAAGGVSGSLGYPKAPQAAVAAGGGGSVQEFTKGTIWSSPAGAFTMTNGPYRAGYLAAGGASGSWGWPTGDAVCRLAGGGCTMAFQNGVGAYSPTTGNVLIPTAVAARWSVAGGPSTLGYPKAAPVQVAANGGGSVQEFTKGTIWSSPAGVFWMSGGPYRAAYLAAGGPAGSWGWPTGDAACRLAGGGCTMGFQNGVGAYSAATGNVLIPTDAAQRWTDAGGPAAIGYPKAAPVQVTANGGGSVQEFTKGTIWSSAAGAFSMLNGLYRTGYLAAGGAAGPWGFPTGPAECRLTGGGCLMSFQNGVGAYSATTGSILVSGRILAEWQARGAQNGALGYPTARATTSGTVTTQRFQGGALRYDSATGAVTSG